MSAFKFSTIQSYLKSRAEPWGEITRLAAAASCQRSYFSRVLKGEVLLTPDHLHGLCEYWRLPEAETDFLSLLLDRERAATPSYQVKLDRRIAKALRDNENLEKRLATPRLETSERELVYYSAWHWSAIHLCTSIKAFQTESAISQALQLHPEIVKSTLIQLSEWGLVKRSGQRWLHGSSNLHLPNQSLLIGQYHRQWRERAANSSIVPSENGLHYTLVQAMDETAFREIMRILLSSIDQTLQVADASESKAVAAVTIDAFLVC